MLARDIHIHSIFEPIDIDEFIGMRFLPHTMRFFLEFSGELCFVHMQENRKRNNLGVIEIEKKKHEFPFPVVQMQKKKKKLTHFRAISKSYT